MFYDLDLLEEKILLEWSEKVSKKYVDKDFSQEIHNRVEPFISWLKEAEEESDSEDDDVEVRSLQSLADCLKDGTPLYLYFLWFVSEF